MQAATCSGVPQRCGCRWASACSSRRARSDKALKPTVAELPASIDGLQDDPYRALAGCVREARGFAKVALPYVEFIWADFLRRRIPRAALADMPAAIALGIELAASPAAAHLPGTPAST